MIAPRGYFEVVKPDRVNKKSFKYKRVPDMIFVQQL